MEPLTDDPADVEEILAAVVEADLRDEPFYRCQGPGAHEFVLAHGRPIDGPVSLAEVPSLEERMRMRKRAEILSVAVRGELPYMLRCPRCSAVAFLARVKGSETLW